MMIEKEELLTIKGGSVSATLLNTLIKIVTTALELGRTIGSTIRRKKTNSKCWKKEEEKIKCRVLALHFLFL